MAQGAPQARVKGAPSGTHLFSLWVCLQTSSSGPALSSQQPAVGWSQATPRRQPGLGSHPAPSLTSLPLGFLLGSPCFTVLKDWEFYCHRPAPRPPLQKTPQMLQSSRAWLSNSFLPLLWVMRKPGRSVPKGWHRSRPSFLPPSLGAWPENWLLVEGDVSRPLSASSPSAPFGHGCQHPFLGPQVAMMALLAPCPSPHGHTPSSSHIFAWTCLAVTALGAGVVGARFGFHKAPGLNSSQRAWIREDKCTHSCVLQDPECLAVRTWGGCCWAVGCHFGLV